MNNFQVTIGAGTRTPLIAAGSPNVYASMLIIQNSAGANCRFGGSTVTSASGIVLATGSPGGSATITLAPPRGCLLNNIYLAGTAGNVIDICYEPGQ